MGYRVEVRDAALNRVGEVDAWITLNLVVRYCQQGTWQIVMESGTAQSDLFQKGGGIAVYQEGVNDPILTGPVESFQHAWDSTLKNGPGYMTISGKCDNKWPYTRLAFLDPGKDVTQQWAADDTRAVSGPAGTLIYNELNSALGPAAITNRRLPSITMGDPDPIGPTKSDSLQWDVIGTKLESWTDTTTTGYRFVYDAASKAIVFKLFTPRDLSKTIRFSKELGNISAFTWTLTAPTVTRAIIACQGTGSSRYMYEQIDTATEAEWNLSIEQFTDRRDLPIKADPTTGAATKADLTTTDADFATAQAAVLTAASDALTSGAKNGAFQITPIDTDLVKFGRDYFVGDIVTVSVDGTEYVDLVQEVTITIDQGGQTRTIQPSIGQDDSSSTVPNIYTTVAAMRDRLRKLEARL